MKIRKYFIAALALLSMSATAQVGPIEGDRPADRIFFGGNFGLQFGSVTFIDVSPLIGYRVTEEFSAGIGFTYQYVKYDDILITEVINGQLRLREADYETSVYGGRVFGRYYFGERYFAHSEIEMLSMEYYDKHRQEPDFVREWVPGFLVGGGIYQPIGSRSGFMATILYNLLYDNARSVYSSPLVIRFGFTF